MPDAPAGARDRFQILVALQRAGQGGRAGGGQVEVSAGRTLVAPRIAHVLPTGREVPERFEFLERRIDGAGGEAGGVHDVEAEAVAVGHGVQDGNRAERERSRLCHSCIGYRPMLVVKIGDGGRRREVPRFSAGPVCRANPSRRRRRRALRSR